MASPLQRLPTNIFSTGAGYGLRVAIAFFFVPFITGVLGDARYGVWVLVFQVVNYFFLFDFGMERAVARFVPQALAKKDFAVLNRVLNSATAVYTLAAVLVLASAWAVLELVYPAFEIGDQALRDEGRLSLLIISVAAAIRFATFPLGGSLGSVHRFDIAKGLEMAEELLKTAVFVWLLLNGYGLVALALTIAILTLVRNAVGFVWLRFRYPRLLHLQRRGRCLRAGSAGAGLCPPVGHRPHSPAGTDSDPC
jgi:O-antigen/teichoic acid export membrane protein